MNALLASFLGFVGGSTATYLVIKHLFRIGFAALCRGDEAMAKAAGMLAQETCYAHAGFLHRMGEHDAAAALLMISYGAPQRPQDHLNCSRSDRRELATTYRRFAYQGNLPFPASGLSLCPKHGQGDYEGHIECRRCERVYGPEAPPHVCACGYRLLPERDDNGDLLPSSGHRLCARCFNEGPDHPGVDPKQPVNPEEQATPLLKGSVAHHLWASCPDCGTELRLSYANFMDHGTPGAPPELCPVCGNKDQTAPPGAIGDLR